ncbi:MAG: SpoIIE family protein phosphatase [Pseudomonadales bacterium]|nr:SpoIIE family protein phosphatase [Pseudomonadales bacterium]
MRMSFSVKLSLAIIILSVGTTATSMAFFYSYTEHSLWQLMRGRLHDLGHTGTFLFGEEERDIIKELKSDVLASNGRLTADRLELGEGEFRSSLSRTQQKEFQSRPDFQKLVVALKKIRAGSGRYLHKLGSIEAGFSNDEGVLLNFVYLMVELDESPDRQVVMTLADTFYEDVDENGNGEIEPDEVGNPIGNLYGTPDDIFRAPFRDKQIHVSEGWYEDQWGRAISAAIPILDEQGDVIAILGMDYLFDNESNILDTLRYYAFAAVVASVLLSLVLSIYVARLLNKPLIKLREGADRVSARDFTFEVDIKNKDEFGLLANAFNTMVNQIRDYASGLEELVKERTADLEKANEKILKLNDDLKEENIRLGAEVSVARKLQEMVLPKEKEMKSIVGLDIAGYMKPADEVGGDYFDVQFSDPERIKFAIGDVTGHGLESGVVMLMVQTAVRTLQISGVTRSEDFLRTINSAIFKNMERIRSDKNMTLSLLDYDGHGNFYLTGQHEDVLILRRTGEIEQIDTTDLGIPIGLAEDISDFTSQRHVYLEEGEILFLHTDGITEAENIHGEQFGLDRLSALVGGYRDLSSDEIKGLIIDHLNRFIGDNKVYDDITLLVIKRSTRDAQVRESLFSVTVDPDQAGEIRAADIAVLFHDLCTGVSRQSGSAELGEKTLTEIIGSFVEFAEDSSSLFIDIIHDIDDQIKLSLSLQGLGDAEASLFALEARIKQLLPFHDFELSEYESVIVLSIGIGECL